MPHRSAGILLYKIVANRALVLLAHPGGPFWRRRDEGAWTIPKGEVEADEGPEETARREAVEEIGLEIKGSLQPLGEIRQRAGKIVTGFAMRGDFDTAALKSGSIEVEWPPRTGRKLSFPEIDRVGWFDLLEARLKINEGQRPFIDRLEAMLSAGAIGPAAGE